MRVCLPSGMILALAAIALAASAAFGAGAIGAEAPPQGERLAGQDAAALIDRAEALLGLRAGRGARISSRAPKADLTPILLRLARAAPKLPPAQRRRAGRLLARPTDAIDPDGDSYPAGAAISRHCTAHFCVHWVDDAGFGDAPDLTDASPANGIPDYVDQVETVAEEVQAAENSALGWRAPRPDETLGGDSKTDVYLADIGRTDTGGLLFGYASTDPGQSGRRRSGYLVLDNDYAEFLGTDPLQDIQVTLAHEYNHVLQFGYDVFQDLWFLEASAVWMEDRVYGGVDDYLRYLGRWKRRVGVPLTQDNIKMYGSSVWNHWLARRYGAGVVRSAWERAVSVRPAAFSVGSYGAAIRAAGRSGFSLDFARFCRDVAEWRTGAAFPEGSAYPDAQRQGSLPLNGSPRFRRLDHTTFRMLRIRPARATALQVDGAVGPGTAAALAVVGRIGTEAGGTVVSALRLKRNGGSMSVKLSRPERFDRITAVLVNADASVSGFGDDDWHYTGNNVRFGVRAALIR